MSFTEDTSEMLLVLNVAHRITEYELFEKFNTSEEAVIKLFTPTDRSRGFAFVTYKSSAEAQNVKTRLDGTLFGGREISVQPTQDGPETNSICNSCRDLQRRFLDKRFPPPKELTVSNEIDCYTRSDYERERERERKKLEREREKLERERKERERKAQEERHESKKRRDDGEKSESGRKESRRDSAGRQADRNSRYYDHGYDASHSHKSDSSKKR